MRRHGWTFCLGLLVGGPALAQPPADTERFPPAPDLPGTVVSKPAGGRPVATAGPLPVRSTSLKPSDAPLPPEPAKSAKPGPYVPVANAVMAPPAPPAPVPPPAPCASPGCASGDHGSIIDWFCYRSKVRDWGCVPKKYVPPLQAWFPCHPKPGCATCPTPVGIAVETAVPVGKPAPGSVPETPKEPPAPPPVKQLGGVSFESGAAPMAMPTTQTNVRSSWRPK
jgi:hypothetical protein